MPPVPFSIWTLLALLVVFGLSCLMFYLHVQRWTRGRAWGNLRDWASRNNFRLHGAAQSVLKTLRPPAPLDLLTSPPPTVSILLSSPAVTIIQMDAPAVGNTPARRWHILIRRLEMDCPTTALRPIHNLTSLTDLFSTSAYPALLASERFTLHGTDALAARTLGKSMITALLPADLGLIIHGRQMLIDFSSRPFDGIELSRILGLGEQLAVHLPLLGGAVKG